MRFDAFNEWQKIMEDTQSNIELELESLNEAFSSDYLRKLSGQESGSRWGNNFAKDFYKYSNIPLDKVTNEDFIILSDPSEWWTQKYHKNNSAIGFFVDDNPEFLEALKKRKSSFAKNADGVGLILSIMRGNRGMWYGFAQDPGANRGRRYKKSPEERYGVLADQYRVGGIYGWDGAKQKAKITKPNLEELATKVYVLDMTILSEKYGSTKELKLKRSEARSGAVAMQTARDIKSQQAAKYDQILKAKLDPNIMLAEVKGALSDYTTWMTAQISDLKFDKSATVKENFYKEMQVSWSGWDSDWSRPLTQMLDILNKFMRAWNEYLKDQASVEKLVNRMESEDDEQKVARLKAEIEYYEGGYKRFVSETVKYRDDLRNYISSVKKITS